MMSSSRQIAAFALLATICTAGSALAQDRVVVSRVPRPVRVVVSGVTRPVRYVVHRMRPPVRVVATRQVRYSRPESVVFTRDDRDVVNRYGATRDRLPAGLERQIRVRGTLPVRLRAYVRPLPGDIGRRMRPLPFGYRRVMIGDDIVLMGAQTWIVYDVMRGPGRW